MKEYKEPIVRVVEFSAKDVIATSGPDTRTPEGILVGASASPNLGVGGSQQ